MWGVKTIAAALALLAGCSLYEGDDDVPTDVDAGFGTDAGAKVAGTYRASWTCGSSTCANPIADTIQAVVADGTPMTIAWVRNGDPGPRTTHSGAMEDERPCLRVQAGTDFGVPRDGYVLCTTSDGLLEGGIVWSGTFSDVVLTKE